MKAAIVKKPGENPVFVENYNQKVPENSNEILVNVKTVAIKNLDKMRASGTHYSLSFADGNPKIVGMDGVGILEDGTAVYASSNEGMLAEKIWVQPESIVKLPENIDFPTAAALPNALMGSALALLNRGKIKKGDTVLINGATGVTGKIATQLAVLYGAEKIYITGRNQEVLEELKPLGNIETINLNQTDDELMTKFKEIDQNTPIDIVIDYLWGKPISLILKSLKGKGKYTHKTKIVTVGSMAGENIELPSSILRSTDIELLGSGLGSWTDEEVNDFAKNILPEMFQLVADGKLFLPTATYPIEEVSERWNENPEGGKRLVFKI